MITKRHREPTSRLRQSPGCPGCDAGTGCIGYARCTGFAGSRWGEGCAGCAGCAGCRDVNRCSGHAGFNRALVALFDPALRRNLPARRYRQARTSEPSTPGAPQSPGAAPVLVFRSSVLQAVRSQGVGGLVGVGSGGRRATGPGVGRRSAVGGRRSRRRALGDGRRVQRSAAASRRWN